MPIARTTYCREAAVVGGDLRQVGTEPGRNEQRITLYDRNVHSRGLSAVLRLVRRGKNK
jgi:hypothetical protein